VLKWSNGDSSGQRWSMWMLADDGLQTACGSSDHPEAPHTCLSYVSKGAAKHTVADGRYVKVTCVHRSTPPNHPIAFVWAGVLLCVGIGACEPLSKYRLRHRSITARQALSTHVRTLQGNQGAEGYLMPAGCERIYLATDSWRGNCVHGQARHPLQVRSSFNI
jgi:hypothetical protein